MIRGRIPYDVLVQNALRQVVRHVLADVSRNGLPGDHHFFITFSTHMAGVSVSSRLRERYPDHMTIVLQHQFWDLQVEEDYFAVTLSFGDVAEKLIIPFAAVRAFYDPVAAFEAAFEAANQHEEEKGGESQGDVVPLPGTDDKSGKIAILNKSELSEETKTLLPAASGPWHNAEKSKKMDGTESGAQADQKAADHQGGDVVSLDAFRKK